MLIWDSADLWGYRASISLNGHIRVFWTYLVKYSSESKKDFRFEFLDQNYII